MTQFLYSSLKRPPPLLLNRNLLLKRSLRDSGWLLICFWTELLYSSNIRVIGYSLSLLCIIYICLIYKNQKFINRVLRHPSVVKYIDGVDSDNLVVIVTEPVAPLLQHLQVRCSESTKYHIKIFVQVFWKYLKYMKYLSKTFRFCLGRVSTPNPN